MDIERIQLKGQLAEAKSKFKRFDTEAAGLIILLRSLLNPFEEDTLRLEIDKAEAAFNRLKDVISEMKTLNTKILKLEEYFD